MKKKILIVEDDVAIARLITMNLEVAGYEALELYNGLDAIDFVKTSKPDLIILDVMLPGMDGFSVMSEIKKIGIPVIFLTAKNKVIDKVNGLNLGADDYMIKPFEAIELIARIEAVLRRYGKDESVLEYKDVMVNLEEHLVKKNGRIIDLSHKEYELLVLLIKNKNMALSREQILSSVWEMDYYGGTRTVDMHIKSIRHKLDLGEYIKTVYKVGYRLED